MRPYSPYGSGLAAGRDPRPLRTRRPVLGQTPRAARSPGLMVGPRSRGRACAPMGDGRDAPRVHGARIVRAAPPAAPSRPGRPSTAVEPARARRAGPPARLRCPAPSRIGVGRCSTASSQDSMRGSAAHRAHAARADGRRPRHGPGQKRSPYRIRRARRRRGLPGAARDRLPGGARTGACRWSSGCSRPALHRAVRSSASARSSWRSTGSSPCCSPARWPRGAFDYLVGTFRWGYRVAAYLHLMTDAYPPFTLADDPDVPGAAADRVPGARSRAGARSSTGCSRIPYLIVAGSIYTLTWALSHRRVLHDPASPGGARAGMFELVMPGAAAGTVRWKRLRLLHGATAARRRSLGADAPARVRSRAQRSSTRSPALLPAPEELRGATGSAAAAARLLAQAAATGVREVRSTSCRIAHDPATRTRRRVASPRRPAHTIATTRPRARVTFTTGKAVRRGRHRGAGDAGSRPDGRADGVRALADPAGGARRPPVDRAGLCVQRLQEAAGRALRHDADADRRGSSASRS